MTAGRLNLGLYSNKVNVYWVLHTHIYAHTHMHTRANTHMHTHTHTHKHTHTHTHKLHDHFAEGGWVGGFYKFHFLVCVLPPTISYMSKVSVLAVPRSKCVRVVPVMRQS